MLKFDFNAKKEHVFFIFNKKNMRKKTLTLGLILAYGILSAQVGINTNNPTNSLDINGDIRIRKADKLSGNSIQPLYINSEGIVGLIPESTQVTSRIFSAIASNTNIVENNNTQLNNFNEGRDNYINLEQSFIKENTLSISSSGGFYKFNESGTFLLNLYINFKITVEESTADAYMLAIVETRKQGESVWNTIVANRLVLRNEGYVRVSRPMVFPSKIVKVEKGSELRLVFRRTRTETGSLQGSKLSYLKVGSEPSYGLEGVSLMISKL